MTSNSGKKNLDAQNTKSEPAVLPCVCGIQRVFLSIRPLFVLRCKRLVKAKTQKTPGYPQVITCLPEAELQVEGAKAWIHQAESSQLVFCQFEAGINLPSHSHAYAQWGIVIEGEMELKIAGQPKTFRKGDEYLVPPGATHSAKFFLRTRVMDLFSEKSRYKPKQKK